MAEEQHFGTVCSGLGAIALLVKGSVQGLALWRRVENADGAVIDFKIQLEFESTKLSCWAQEWNIEEPEKITDRRFRMSEPEVTKYLDLIYRVTKDLSNLLPEFDTPETTPQRNISDSTRHESHLGSSAADSQAPDHADASLTASMSPSARLKWAIQQGGGNEKLGCLSRQIQSLYQFLPPPNSDSASVIVSDTHLSSQDANALARVSHAIGSEPLHAGLAWMRSIAYRTQPGPTGIFRLDSSLVIDRKKHPNDSRFMASYDGNPAFIEQKYVTVPQGANGVMQRSVIKKRIENLVLRLQDPAKPAELRTLPCRGAIVKPLDTVTSIYSIVYRVDALECFSLQDILRRKDRRPEEIRRFKDSLPLGRRFVIAQTLARGVMFLHVAGWLHKAIRSDNILFFADDIDGLISTLPYLVGFEYSRPDAHGELTENIIDEEGHKYYRHPKAQATPVADFQEPLGGAGRYSKAYDIYSVGVILVELGLFKSVKQIVADHLGFQANPTKEDIRSVLLEHAIPHLKFNMGETYANAACICLDGFFDQLDQISLGAAFLNNVVRPLGLCNA